LVTSSVLRWRPSADSFLHLNLRCKQELVASACGVDTGLFAFHFSKLLMISRLRKSKCFLPKHHNFKRKYIDLLLGVAVKGRALCVLRNIRTSGG